MRRWGAYIPGLLPGVIALLAVLAMWRSPEPPLRSTTPGGFGYVLPIVRGSTTLAPHLMSGTAEQSTADLDLATLDPAAIKRAALALQRELGRPVKVLPPLVAPEWTFDDHGRFRADALLDAALLEAPGDAFRIAAVTNSALVAPGYRYVIGYARHGERAVVYSTHRLHSDHAHEAEDVHQQRVRRILAHELGHTYGAEHCESDCLMRTTRTVADIDALPDTWCAHHAPLVERGRGQSPSDPEMVASVARERMRLKRWGEAIGLYRKALAHAPSDPTLHLGLGIALMGHGHLKAALERFEDAEHLAPDAPGAFYARAVVFAAGYDPFRAPAYLEAAVRRDPRPARGHRAAGILYQDLLSDKASAIRHFQQHLAAGGHDSDVLERLSDLTPVKVVRFDQPETIIGRSEPLVTTAIYAVAEAMLGLDQQQVQASLPGLAAGVSHLDHTRADELDLLGDALEAAVTASRAKHPSAWR